MTQTTNPSANKKSSVKNKKGGKQASTQRFLPFGEIRDNTLVMKDGGLRAIIKTSAVNFHLKSEDEQNALIYGYQSFLNSLDFPIQIVIRSKKLDVDQYLENLTQMAQNQDQPLLRKQTFEYIEYIKKLVEYADIMEKNFFVIVPHDPPRAKDPTTAQKFMKWISPDDQLAQIRMRHKEFAKLRKVLSQRVTVVKTGLENCGLRTEELDTHQIVELFYQAYNPITSRNQKLKGVAGNDLIPM